MAIRLERTIWPVGHGAFYTEQFKNDNNDVLFTAVYDCGSYQKNALQKSIDEFLPKKGTLVIDALFISHFHADHVNLLAYLLQQNVHVKDLFIPQLTDDYILSLLVSCSIDTATNRNIVVALIGLLYSGETFKNVENIYEVPSVNEDKTGDMTEYPADENISRRKHKVAPVVLPYQLDSQIPFWVYIPYNIFASNALLKPALIQGGYTTNGTDVDINKVFVDIQKNQWKKLQGVYGQVFSNDPNEYSMTVYSGRDMQASLKICVRPYHFSCCGCDYPRCHCYGSHLLEQESGCLYMGDFMAKQHDVQLINFYNSKVHHDAWKNTWLMQIPHHGSYYNHKDTLYANHPKVTFVSTAVKDKDGHPHLQTLIDVSNKHCPIVIVQDNKATCLRVDYIIS